MRYTFLAALLLFTAPAFAQGKPDAAPCTSAQHRQFDFWVGNWEVKNAKGEVVGTNHVESLLGGCVIQENWKGVSGSRGKSYNMYFARDGKWHQTWVDGQGGRLDLVGELVKGEMVLSGTMPDEKGKPVKHEIRFKKLDDGRVKQHWRVSKNGGKKWKDAFLGFYVKVDDTVAASQGIEKAALDYALGWYDADADRVSRALHPELAKRRGYFVEGNGKKWDKLDQMSAMTLVRHTRERKPDPKEPRRAEVEILDITGNAATAKLTMNDWVDYLHLVKTTDGRWVIVNVLWEKF